MKAPFSSRGILSETLAKKQTNANVSEDVWRQLPVYRGVYIDGGGEVTLTTDLGVTDTKVPHHVYQRISEDKQTP